MSTGPSDSVRPKRFFGPTTSIMFLAWVAVIVVASILHHFTEQRVADHGTTDQTDQGKVASTPGAPKSDMEGRSTASRPSSGSPIVATPTPVAQVPPTPEEVARTRLRWMRVKGQIEELRELLHRTTVDVESWTTLVGQLSENDAGKRIAGSKMHVDQYRVLLEQPRKPVRLAGECRDMIQVHLETVAKYQDQTENITLPDAAMLKDLEQLQNDIQALAKEYHRDRVALEKIVSDTAKMPLSQLTLEKAVEEREKEVSGEYLTQLTAAKERAENDGQRKIRDAEEKAIKEKAQAEADRLASEAKAEGERRNREAETKRLRTLAEDPEIQKIYSAFLQKGYMRFNCSPTGGQPTKTDRPRPASYVELHSHGWLNTAETFARAMSKRLNHDYLIFNDRPTHPYPTNSDEWDEMEKLLKQFKELAPLWVEMKLLEP
jgi:hypothetical protein